MHFGKTSATTQEGESRMILIMNFNLYLVSVFVNDADPSTEHKGKLTCLNEQVKISFVFHCDGLLLCILKDDDTKVVVWNPYWGQTMWIYTRYSLMDACGPFDRFSYTLGYEKKKSRRSYKLLRFIDTNLFNFENDLVWYEIYDFDFDLWKTLDVVTPYWRIHCGQHSVSVKGNTYWFATKKNSRGEWDCWFDHLICFDFTREKFGRLLPLPCPCYDDEDHCVTLSCVREEKLMVLPQNRDNPNMFVIWISTMIKAKKILWSKFLRVNAGSHADITLPYGSFFIDEVKNVAMLFDIRLNRYTVDIINGEARQVDLEEFMEESWLTHVCSYVRRVDLEEAIEERWWPRVCSYVPSLVEIKKPKGGQRKEQSILEKHRYVQKLLRLSVFKWRCLRHAAALREEKRLSEWY
ncbi:hypothetical protein EUTSA_v10015830mg [Eutrema salsugineum]|uniref:F-box associated beta-propeller type 1 domain-containing protein n=1 Tax=Eutrema salsugineum TaxID=72664 RepID=V4LIM5_EUTSA|nr:hypothetical protein EUTSA_v10015830mg [Eutrema salsugineum]